MHHPVDRAKRIASIAPVLTSQFTGNCQHWDKRNTIPELYVHEGEQSVPLSNRHYEPGIKQAADKMTLKLERICDIQTRQAGQPGWSSGYTENA